MISYRAQIEPKMGSQGPYRAQKEALIKALLEPYWSPIGAFGSTDWAATAWVATDWVATDCQAPADQGLTDGGLRKIIGNYTTYIAFRTFFG